MDTDTIRKRLGELNTKAYYLLVALSFLFAKNVMLSLKFPFLPLAIGLTAFVAVVPLQDYFESERALSRIRWLKVVLLSAAFLSTLLWLLFSHAVPAAAAQKPTPPQPTEQQNSKDSPGDPESRLKAAEEKADRALMEKDYIERIQKEVNAYYEKAFNSLMAIVGIISLLIAVGATFGVNNLVQSKLTDASTRLREEFTKILDEKFAQLEKSHADRLKQLEGSLQERISSLGEDLEIRGKFSSWSLQGTALLVGNQPADAIDSFRKALAFYKRGKARQLFVTKSGGQVIANLFLALKRLNPPQFDEAAKKEIATPTYEDLDEELALAALENAYLAPLIKHRKVAPPTAAPETATTEAAPPATPPAEPAPGTPSAPPDNAKKKKN